MPYDYAVLDNGQGGGKKPRSAKTKAVRAYLKSKGVKPTKDAASRSTRERKLRAKAREEFAKKSKPSGTSSSTSKPSTASQGRAAGTTRKGGAPAKPYGKFPSKSASGDSWKRGSMPKGK